MKPKWFFSLLILIFAVALLGGVSAFAEQGDSLSWWTVDGGGGIWQHWNGNQLPDQCHHRPGHLEQRHDCFNRHSNASGRRF